MITKDLLVKHSLALASLMLALALAFPAAGQDIVVVKPSSAPANVRVDFIAQPNGSTMVITDNKHSLATNVQCRYADGSANDGLTISVKVPISAVTLNTTTVIFPNSGGPFTGSCTVNKTGGVGPSGVGAAGPTGPPSLGPIVAYDITGTTQYCPGPPISRVQYTDGLVYESLACSTGVTPTNDLVNWAQTTVVGPTGPAGATGATGAAGAPGAGTGDAVGPAGATAGQLAKLDATGKILSAVTISGVPNCTTGVCAAITGTATNAVKVNGTSAPFFDPTAGGAITGATSVTKLLPVSVTFAANSGSGPASVTVGEEYSFSDATAAGTCSGGGSAWSKCRCTTVVAGFCTVWTSIGGGGGGGLPGNVAGSILYNTGSAWVSRIFKGFTANSTDIVNDGTVIPELAGDNVWTGYESHVPASTQAITAGTGGAATTLTCDSAEIAISPDAAYVLGNNLQITAGVKAHQRCRIVNIATTGSFTVTFGDNNASGATPSSGVRLQSSQVQLPGLGRFIDMEWDVPSTSWVQSGVASAATPVLPVTTKGDLMVYTTQATRLGVGSNGSVLFADSTQASGMQWFAVTWDLNMLKDTDGTMAANSNARVPTQAAAKAYTDSAIAAYAPHKIAANTTALSTGALAANTCATVTDVTATGTLSTDTINWSPNADWSGLVGYGILSTDGLKIFMWPTADAVHFKVCNGTSASITVPAASVNWRVAR